MCKLIKTSMAIATFLFLFMSSYAQIPTDGLVAYYPFNGNANDESGNGNHGITNSGISWHSDRFSNSGNAIRMDGNTGFVEVPSSTSLESPTNALSGSGWIYREEEGYTTDTWVSAIFSKSNTIHYGQYGFAIHHYASDKVLVYLGNWCGGISHPLASYNWYFLAFSWDGNILKIFVNNEKIYEQNYPSILIQNSMPLLIGCDTPGKSEYLNGRLDDIRIYNRALNEQEILALYNENSYNAINVTIDIKPGSFPNSISCDNENGLIPVAILSSPEFDARTVDHTTVTFGPNGATEAHCIVTPKSKDKGLSSARPCSPKRHEEDVDGDGDIDLVFHFQHSKTGFTCSDTMGILKGKTFDGIEIIGSDAIRPVPPENQPNPFVVNEPIPHESILFDNYPNPFNPSTSIKYGIPEASHVILSVYNTLGQRVALLVDKKQEAGYHEVTFDASRLTSGMYFYRLQAGNFNSVKKMSLVK